ncbi:TPA: hypothetical protein N0F65_002477 [Lagenidium giganteum]|uniref:Dymeclin n=1 Tax=Lagenidium giganteum TaxID=4803 RepID=A0AAV2YS24_9STRA|nr:TPA: hypothetical protein N0F65_002477 [Lagenidium giganteum]
MLPIRMREVAKATNGTGGDTDRLLVMTYNVLAQCYVRSSFFPYCVPSVLRWRNRSTALEEVFKSMPVRPDVICLQVSSDVSSAMCEVLGSYEVDQYSEFWEGMMAKLGYTGLYVKKASTKKDGVALFWNSDQVALQCHEALSLDEPTPDESDCSEDLLSRVCRGNVGVIAYFRKQLSSGQQFGFGLVTTHLFWDPTQEDVKLLQVRRIMHHLDAFNASRRLPVIFAGDFNSLPGSHVYNRITQEGKFHSAYTASTGNKEPEFTNVNGVDETKDGKKVPKFIGTLDYIFYKAQRFVYSFCHSDDQGHDVDTVPCSFSLRPVALLETPSYAEATREIALPSTFSPSDHLPLMCEFEVRAYSGVIDVSKAPASGDVSSERGAGNTERSMGGAGSSFTRADADASVFASPKIKSAFEKIAGDVPVLREDSAYQTVFSVTPTLNKLTQKQVEELNYEYGATIALNNSKSGNFRVLLRYVIHSLPFCCRLAKMNPDEFDAQAATTSGSALDQQDGKKKSVEDHVNQTINALFLIRSFAMRFVEKQDVCSMLSHFNRPPPQAEWNTIISPRVGSFRTNGGASAIMQEVPESALPQTVSDDLAFRFLDALLTATIDFPPTPKTYDLHVEVISTLLVLLSPVAFPRDHTKAAGDLSAHNPFLHMLMSSAAPGGKRTFWSTGLVQRMLQNYIDHTLAPATSKGALTTTIAVEKAEELSLIKIAEANGTAADVDGFSYLTLEGIGSLANTIFRFPWSFYQYFVASDGEAYPLADRSVLVLLVLLQSCRDGENAVNPYRDAVCGIVDSEESSEDCDTVQLKTGESRAKAMELPYSKIFCALGRKAPYESSHLLLYTLMYTNTMMHDATLARCDVSQLMLPLLETLYHAKAVEPSRIYMLVIVLLTYTQDAGFVRDAHTQMVVHNVPWYSERYILDVSLGSLMMVIFTRLIQRNITQFQDSFIHVNAFAGLSNLARYAENIHMYAAQSMVELIDLLAKKEAKLVERMETTPEPEMDETLVQRRSAYIEFIRLLLGVTSSCLKVKLLPRNPQLIYSLVYRAETFDKLQQHPEFTHQVNNGPVWSTLSRFRTLIESKTGQDDTLDVETVLSVIRSECTSLLASSASSGIHGNGPPPSRRGSDACLEDEEASYRYEEETDPEQFFIPYIWNLIYQHTPEFFWKVDKITLFVPNRTVVADVVAMLLAKRHCGRATRWWRQTRRWQHQLVQKAVQDARRRLQMCGQDPNDAKALVAQALDPPLASGRDVFLHLERAVDRHETERLNELVERRCQGEPLAYVVGFKEFWSMRFRVDRNTLIPRSDSEVLIDALKELHPRDKSLRILDIGTGSGCLLLAALSEFPSAEGVGLDISLGALSMAQTNANDLHLAERARFVRKDLSRLPAELRDEGTGHALHHQFDVIICNPPYIPRRELALVAPDVLAYEPHLALFSGGPHMISSDEEREEIKDTGLQMYMHVAECVQHLLDPRTDGTVLLETGSTQQAMDVQQLFHERTDLRVHRLLHDIEQRTRGLSDASERVADKGRATGPRSSSTGSLARPRSRRENQEGNAREPVDSSKNPDDVAGSPDGLGVEATLRYQKARLRVLQDELDSSTARVKELHAANANLKAKVEELSAECANANKKTQQTQQLFEKQKELVAAQESKQKILETQLATAQTRIDELERAEKQTTLQFRSKDVRLNRALEELEKVKQQLQEDRKTQGEQMIAKTEYESVVKENKRLEKQKSELLVAFKKQMKLIDLLKRQRIHMEAAKMLSFTEEEFSRTLELG